MIFSYFQDGHLHLRNSVNRIGSYEEDWFIKFDELLSISKERDVDGIIDGGDLLSRAEPSYRTLDMIADRVEANKITMHSILGNHASRYGSVKNSAYAGLSHLIKRCKFIEYLDTIKYHGNQFKPFHIKGVDYYYGIEEDLKKDGLFFKDVPEDCWKIAVIHAFVSPKPFPYASHVTCDELKTDADLALIAHYHSPWIRTVGNTEFVDISCFGRNTINEATHEPSCIILDTEKRSYEIIKLKTAKKAEDCFNLEKVAEKKDKESKLSMFLEELQNTSFKSIQLKDRIKELGKKNGIDVSILKNIYERMEEI